MKRKVLELAIKTVIITFTIVWIFVIFSFSNEPAEVSKGRSKTVQTQVNAVLAQHPIPKDKPPVQLTEHQIRKSAHITEYFILGMLLTLSLLVLKKDRHIFIVASTAGIAIACIDEYIQRFTLGRGPGFIDILIDTAGLLAGILCIHFALSVVKRIVNL